MISERKARTLSPEECVSNDECLKDMVSSFAERISQRVEQYFPRTLPDPRYRLPFEKDKVYIVFEKPIRGYYSLRYFSRDKLVADIQDHANIKSIELTIYASKPFIAYLYNDSGGEVAKLAFLESPLAVLAPIAMLWLRSGGGAVIRSDNEKGASWIAEFLSLVKEIPSYESVKSVTIRELADDKHKVEAFEVLYPTQFSDFILKRGVFVNLKGPESRDDFLLLAELMHSGSTIARLTYNPLHATSIHIYYLDELARRVNARKQFGYVLSEEALKKVEKTIKQYAEVYKLTYVAIHAMKNGL